MPAEQSIHVAAEVARVAVLNVPALHSLHTDAIAADHVPALHPAHEPALAADECPAVQPLQTVALAAANVPALQSTHDAAPAEDDDPAVQPTQSVLFCAPLLGLAVPAEQSIHVAAEVAFVAVLYFPELHSMQTDAEEREYVPAPHTLQVETEEAPSVELNVPAPQPWQHVSRYVSIVELTSQPLFFSWVKVPASQLRVQPPE